GKRRPWLGWGIRRRLLALIMASAFVALAAIFAFMAVGADPAHPDEAEEPAPSAAADSSGMGYSIYGEDVYAELKSPGAMINIYSLPVEPSLGDEFTIEIGVKTPSGLKDIREAGRAFRPMLQNSEYEGMSLRRRASGKDSLAIFSFRYRAMKPGAEAVAAAGIKIGEDTVRYSEERFQIVDARE
ncbi:MAG: hypothetical protein NC102_09685, partial [Clostridium sp.]|nr:hypothetical protein [Clostridium sp.]